VSIDILAIGPENPHLVRVIQLHGSAKATLGFLPSQVFADQATKGCLLVAIDSSGDLVGYALYDLPRNEIRLTHLCVDADHHGKGIARELVEALCQRHPNRIGIRARCRRSWPANDMWPHLDFAPLNDTPGRSREGHLITTWWRDFGHPTLFSRLPSEIEPRIGAALDTDVFLDLFDGTRTGSSESQGLRVGVME
jgi:GNAT superfamily N-acetyltransferase